MDAYIVMSILISENVSRTAMTRRLWVYLFILDFQTSTQCLSYIYIVMFFMIIVQNGIGYSDKVKSEKGIKGIKTDYIHITHTFIIYTPSPHNTLHRSVINKHR